MGKNEVTHIRYCVNESLCATDRARYSIVKITMMVVSSPNRVRILDGEVWNVGMVDKVVKMALLVRSAYPILTYSGCTYVPEQDRAGHKDVNKERLSPTPRFLHQQIQPPLPRTPYTICHGIMILVFWVEPKHLSKVGYMMHLFRPSSFPFPCVESLRLRMQMAVHVLCEKGRPRVPAKRGGQGIDGRVGPLAMPEPRGRWGSGLSTRCVEEDMRCAGIGMEGKCTAPAPFRRLRRRRAGRSRLRWTSFGQLVLLPVQPRSWRRVCHDLFCRPRACKLLTTTIDASAACLGISPKGTKGYNRG